jgi:hypothetical protein
MASPTSPTATRTTFPDPLKKYVARTFEDVSAEEKKDVEAELKRIITNAFNDKLVWSIDWDNMPLPQSILAKRRAEERHSKPMADVMGYSNSDVIPTRAFGKFNLNDNKKRKRSEPCFPFWRWKLKLTSCSFGEESVSANQYNDRYDKKARHESPYPSTDKLSQRDKERRARRFADELRARTVTPPDRESSPSNNDQPLVGRCVKLEKQYFRLTSAPDPDNVRPLHVLEKTLELLKRKWREEQNYSYICDQFKSLRQDLTVQHIKSDFTVLVYEIHARIALEKASYAYCSTFPVLT